MTEIVKAWGNRLARALGLTVSRRDQLAELIPPNYLSSPYLPRIYRSSAGRLLYFRDMMERIAGVPGDVVECGVSIGHGLLYFMLLGEMMGQGRTVWGFDSFEGFPESTAPDAKADGSYQAPKGHYATPAQLVSRVLQDGHVAQQLIDKNLRLVKGFFDETLSRYDGTIALLHLDCDLYASYRTCLSSLYERVAPSGLILFDEYEDDRFPGARRAVDEFFSDKGEEPSEYNRYGYRKFYIVKGRRSLSSTDRSVDVPRQASAAPLGTTSPCASST